jgi:uncharacterized protein (DUF849 family)
LAEGSAEQVVAARKILDGLSLEVASPDEAREILQPKRRDATLI